MRVHTKLEYQWDGHKGEYVLVHEEGYDYEGPVALMKDMGQGAAKGTLGSEQGAESNLTGRGTAAWNASFPELMSQASNPKGFSPGDLAKINTANSESTGGSTAGIVGQGNLMAGRTRNPGSMAAALDEAARTAGRTESHNALGIQEANANLAQQKQQHALGELSGLYGENVKGLNSMFGNENESVKNITAADQASAQALQKDIGMGMQLATTPFGGGAAKNGLAGLA